MRCFNCLDEVDMEHLGDGFYRCPVCGDERDTKYEEMMQEAQAEMAYYDPADDPDYEDPAIDYGGY